MLISLAVLDGRMTESVGRVLLLLRGLVILLAHVHLCLLERVVSLHRRQNWNLHNRWRSCKLRIVKGREHTALNVHKMTGRGQGYEEWRSDMAIQFLVDRGRG